MNSSINESELFDIENDLDFTIVELEDVTALPETAASSGSSSCAAFCGSCSCST